MPKISSSLRKSSIKDKSLDSLLENFILWKRAEGLSTTTINDYRRHVLMFLKRYPEVRNDPKLLKKSVLEYMADNIKPATYNLRFIYLKAFFSWVIREGAFKENPLQGLKKRRAEARIVNIDTDTLKRLFELPDLTTFAGLRDYALLLLEMDTGIRPKEVLNLRPSDINLKSLEVLVRADISKTRVQRTLPINPITANAIMKLLHIRPDEWGDKVTVFCSNEGKNLQLESWRTRLDWYSKKLGTKIRPYDLRHMFALEYLRNGGHAIALQRTLGHTDLTMTKRYVALTSNDLKEQHTMASPVAKLITTQRRIRKI